MNLWAKIRNRAQVARGPCWQLFPPRTSLDSAPEGLPRLALPPGPHGLLASCWSTREITPTVTKADTSPFQGLSVFSPRPSRHLKYCSASHSSLYRSGRGWGGACLSACLFLCASLPKPAWKVTLRQKPPMASHHLLEAYSILKISSIC